MGIASSVYRISDREYQFQASNGKVFQFDVKGKKLSPQARMESATKTARMIEQNLKQRAPTASKKFKDFTFNDGVKRWEVKRPLDFRWYHELLLFFLPTLNWLQPVKSSSIKLEVYAKGGLNRPKRRAESPITSKMVQSFGLDPVPRDLRKLDVKAQCQNLSPAAASGYRDPFTKLAAFSFQCVDESFIENDGKKNPEEEKKKLVFIESNGTILLVAADSRHATAARKQRAFDAFLSHIDKFYGREKCEYINYLYGLKLEDQHHLTPEMVYRFNIGTTNTEIQDLEAAYASLLSLRRQVTPEIFNEPFSYLEDYLTPASLFYGMERVLKQKFQKDPPLVKDFCLWLDGLNLTSERLPVSNPAVFDHLVSVIRPSDEEIERSYTGKKICQLIQSAYTTAGTKTYKPWIDQQELTQISQELVKCSSFESYMEYLAHVVVKKHLCREHPHEKFRVGALIPAPPEVPGGPVRWYKVTRCATNQYIYSYTLESACNDRTLPAVETFRSTASSEYALYSSGSVSNDFGQLNAPGFMGIKLLEKYKNDFYHDRTIPLWVGYHYNAKSHLIKNSDLKDVLHNLKMSNQRLLESESEAKRPKTFREVLKDHDAVLNDLFLRYAHILDYDTRDHFPEFINHFKKIVGDYIQIDYRLADGLPSSKVKADAKLLYRQLSKIQYQKLKKFEKPGVINADVERLKDLIRELKTDLIGHILADEPNSEGRRELEAFYQSTFQPLEILKGEAENLLRQGYAKEARKKMEQWANALNQLAVLRKENVESKIHQHICLTGHSLGGAEALAGFANAISNQGRIPLPDYQCTVGIFDSPGINIEDNEKFKKLGNENHELFNEIKVRFKLFIREESGDFFRLGGETKLGSTRSEKEAQMVEKWLNFDAAVNERLSTCTQRAIAESAHRHSTRFLEGKPVKVHKMIDRERIVTKEGIPVKNPDYRQIHYSTFIQGLLDSHGKNTDLLPEDAAEMAEDLYANVWKLPRRLGWQKLLREEKRKSVSWFFLLARKILYLFLSCGRKGKHVLPSKVLDSKGCFAVRLNQGVMTKNPAAA